MNLPVALQILEKLKGSETLNCLFVAVRIRMGPKLEPQPTRTLIFHLSFSKCVLVEFYEDDNFAPTIEIRDIYIYIYTHTPKL